MQAVMFQGHKTMYGHIRLFRSAIRKDYRAAHSRYGTAESNLSSSLQVPHIHSLQYIERKMER